MLRHERHAVRIAGEKHHRAGRRSDRLIVGFIEKLFDRLDLVVQAQRDTAPALEPRERNRRERRADQKRHVSAFEKFRQTRKNEASVDEDKREQRRCGNPWIPIALARNDEIERDRGSRHRDGNGQTVRGREPVARTERDHEQRTRDAERHVDRRNEDLSGIAIRRVHDFHAQTQTQGDRLFRERKRPRDQRLRCDDRGRRREHHHRDEQRAETSA